MTDNNNGIWKGRTEATLEAIAHTLDDIKGQIGLNCPIGRENKERIHILEQQKGAWFDTLLTIVLTAVIAAAATRLF